MVFGRLKCLQVREILRERENKAGLDVKIHLRLRDIETTSELKFSQIPSATVSQRRIILEF
jgi:hypothetical protein